MQTLLQQHQQEAKKEKDASQPRLVIVGNGPVGVRCCNLLLEKLPTARLAIFGEENTSPYNRVRLSDYLSGSIEKAQLDNPIIADETVHLSKHWGTKVTTIEPATQTLLDSEGHRWAYDKLILATGASARWPPQICKKNLQGVLVFRTLEDAATIRNFKHQYKRFVVVGSGALGVETAHALKEPGNQVILLLGSQLIDGSFDETAQQILKDHLLARGIELSRQAVQSLQGQIRLEAITTQEGTEIPCDCVIFCIGITPNIELAKRAGLATDKGIRVDAFGRTSFPNIYAIGECSQRDDRTFGLVTPGYLQAQACVLDIVRRLGSDSTDKVALRATAQSSNADETIDHQWHRNQYPLSVKLKDYNAVQYGQTTDNEADSYIYTDELRGIYRKLFIRNKRLAGATLIGECKEQNDLKIAIETGQKIRQKSLLNFVQAGRLFGDDRKRAKDLPDDYIVCLCENVSKKQISDAIADGCRQLDSLGDQLKAGVNCGSCKPILAELLDTPAPNLVMRHQKSIFIASIVSLIAILLLLLIHPLPVSSSIQVNWYLEKLWFDNYCKQISGFTLLGLCTIASALTLRKRLKKFNLGHLDEWRYAHSVVGLISVFMLLIHTGGRLGENLNLLLMTVFLAATTTGSLVGVFMARNHHWSDQKLRTHRLWWSRLHHTLLWSLPPLLVFHILSAYYF